MKETSVSTKAALLAVLTRGEGYGLELRDRVSVHSGGHITVAVGRVYPTLQRLEAGGYVTSREDKTTQGRGGRLRRHYRLTARGRRLASEQAQAILSLFFRVRV